MDEQLTTKQIREADSYNEGFDAALNEVRKLTDDPATIDVIDRLLLGEEVVQSGRLAPLHDAECDCSQCREEDRLGYDADFGDRSQYCRHGTFIGSWWGPDHLCYLCESE